MLSLSYNSGELRDVFMHEDAVYGISVDPTNDNVFASACVDGRILIYDIRLPPQSGKLVTSQRRRSICFSVSVHPPSDVGSLLSFCYILYKAVDMSCLHFPIGTVDDKGYKVFLHLMMYIVELVMFSRN